MLSRIRRASLLVAAKPGLAYRGSERSTALARQGIAILVALLANPGVAAGMDADLQRRVDEAIRAGRDNLLPRLSELCDEPRQDYPMGRIALPLAALLQAGLPADHPDVDKAFEQLDAMPLRRTYSVACYIFALEARRLQRFSASTTRSAPKKPTRRTGVRQRKEAGPQARPGGNKNPRMEALVRWLVDARLTGLGSWTYGKAENGEKHDFSNAQFAILGLYVGLQRGTRAPRVVFDEVARLFTNSLLSEPAPVRVTLTRSPSLETTLGLTAAVHPLTFVDSPGGWGYRPARRESARRAVPPGPGKPGEIPPYPSMTAAGASSLAIAIEALTGHGPLERRLTHPPQLQRAQDSLLAACAWIGKHFDEFLKNDHNLFYRLYSLEKVGDLAEIDRFGSRDWYQEGAATLLRAQHTDGSFGSYVDTSFALLFLTRSSRALKVTAAPILLTGARRPDGDTNTDLVYIHSAGGFLSARAILRYVGEIRKSSLLPVTTEVVKNYHPSKTEELVPSLLALWDRKDSITRFSRQALTEITGVRSRQRGDYVAWYEELEAIRKFEARQELTAADVRARISNCSSEDLKSRLVAVARRRKMRDLGAFLIAEAPRAETPRYRKALHGTLKLWTGALIASPRWDSDPGWKETTVEWERWWETNARNLGH